MTRRRPRTLHLALLAPLVLAGTAAAVICGNGVREGGEQCDRTDTGGVLCENLCFDGGPLGCRADCTFDTSACTVCGNARKEPGEACDGADLGGWTCQEGGVSACTADCLAIDQRGCFRCGNGVREGGEQCDQLDFGGAACDAPGEQGGELACTGGAEPGVPPCRIDRTPCWRCGNGRVDPGEECDAGAANGTDGVGCSTACTGRCGDGLLQSGELCDDGNRVDGDGCSADCQLEGSYGGGTAGDTGTVDVCTVDWSVAGLATAAVNACTDGAPCDRDGAADGGCAFLVGFCTNVSQSPQAGSVPCRPTDVASVALAADATLDAPARAAFLAAMRGVLAAGGGTVEQTGDAVSVTPATSLRGVCAQFAARVPRQAAHVLAVDARDSGAALDHDRLTLRCD